MKIAIVGPGAIGSTFAFQLARAGHEVTVVGRGARLACLEKEQAIVRDDGARAAVSVTSALDTSVPYDLVLVTVLAPQVDATLPSLRASAAKRVMLMFNTFQPLDPWREAIGAQRFSFGFPMGVFCLLVDGMIRPTIRAGTTASDAELAKVFTEAGIPTGVEPDMQGWLRTHAALVAPMMGIGVISAARGSATWAEASTHAAAFVAGFAIVRSLGHSPTPALFGALAKLPRFLLAFTLWVMSRTRLSSDLGKLGAAEPRMLIDQMNSAAPHLAGPLVAIRP